MKSQSLRLGKLCNFRSIEQEEFFMRLAKRIATVALAAVIALSMLTACGGGGSSTGGNSGSTKPDKPGTSDTDKPGTGDNNNTEKPGDSKPSKDDTTKIRYADTRTAKYFASKGATQGNVYLEATVKKTGWEGPIVYARRGRTARYNWDFTSTTQKKMYTRENRLAIEDNVYILDTERKQYDIYTDYYPATEKDMKDAADNVRCANGFFMVPADDSNLQEIKIGECEVNGKKFYAETILLRTSGNDTSWFGHYFIYCFEKNDVNGTNLKYVVQNDNQGQTIVTIQKVKSNPDQSLLEIPADYELVNEENWDKK